MMQNLIEEVKQKFSVCPSARYVEKILSSQSAATAKDIYKKILYDNLNEVVETSSLPFGIASQTASTIPTDILLQISTSRDATQPLRPSADATAEEITLYGSGQKNSPNRLLKLLLTDGINSIGAFELATLRVFRSIPIPGEKVLIKAGAEVKNGNIILSDDHVLLLGGEVHELKKAFLDHHQRVVSTARSGYQTSTGIEGAPKFQPLSLGLSKGNSFARDYEGERQGQPDRRPFTTPQDEPQVNQNARKNNYNRGGEGKRGFGRGHTSSYQRGNSGRTGIQGGHFNNPINVGGVNVENSEEHFQPHLEQHPSAPFRGAAMPRGNSSRGRGRSGRGRWHRGSVATHHMDPVS